jgi:hypothetical protein
MIEVVGTGLAARKETYRVRRQLGFSSFKRLRELGIVLKVWGEGASQLQNLHRHSKSAREVGQDLSNRFPLLKDKIEVHSDLFVLCRRLMATTRKRANLELLGAMFRISIGSGELICLLQSSSRSFAPAITTPYLTTSISSLSISSLFPTSFLAGSTSLL